MIPWDKLVAEYSYKVPEWRALVTTMDDGRFQLWISRNGAISPAGEWRVGSDLCAFIVMQGKRERHGNSMIPDVDTLFRIRGRVLDKHDDDEFESDFMKRLHGKVEKKWGTKVEEEVSDPVIVEAVFEQDKSLDALGEPMDIIRSLGETDEALRDRINATIDRRKAFGSMGGTIALAGHDLGEDLNDFAQALPVGVSVAMVSDDLIDRSFGKHRGYRESMVDFRARIRMGLQGRKQCH